MNKKFYVVSYFCILVVSGVECRIPSFWKRIAAEFIDFMILFFVKIAVTYVAIDFFHLV